MMDNMLIYNQGRVVPNEAQKPIKAGRLRGKTDINPMWRIAKLTEIFGPCGIGWKYVITKREMIPGANSEISCFVDIDLFYKWEGAWSEAVPGTGGSSYVAKESGGLYTSDECFKMALTDALSVACKALGIGADIYWEDGRSKYTGAPEPQQQAPKQQTQQTFICESCGKPITTVKKKSGEPWLPAEMAAYSKARWGGELCYECQKKIIEAEKLANDAEALKHEDAGDRV